MSLHVSNVKVWNDSKRNEKADPGQGRPFRQAREQISLG